MLKRVFIHTPNHFGALKAVVLVFALRVTLADNKNKFQRFFNHSRRGVTNDDWKELFKLPQYI